MADPLSITAGVVGITAFAQQLTESVFKIKAFCKDVSNAPAELLDLIEEITHMSKMLHRLGQQHQGEVLDDSEDIMQESLRHCRRAIDRVTSLALECQAEMSKKRRRGAVKMVLKQDLLNATVLKLERSKFDLLFARTMHEDSRRRRESEEIRKFMEEERAGRTQMIEYTQQLSATTTTTDPYLEDHHVLRGRKRFAEGYRSSSTKIQFRVPRWLCENVWQVAFAQAAGRWTCSLTTFRVLPYDHEGILAIWSGDLGSLLRALDNRTLTVHDRTEFGGSLLWEAVTNAQIEIVKFLSSYDVERGILFLRIHCPEHFAENQEVAKWILEETEDDIDEMDLPTFQALSKEKSSWTVSEQLAGMRWYSPHVDFLFETFDQIGELKPELFFETDDWSQSTMLHVLAMHIGKGFHDQFILDAVETGFRLCGTSHSKDLLRRTPFLVIIDESYPGDATHNTHVWLQCARKAGVDLVEYWRAAKLAWQNRQMEIIDRGWNYPFNKWFLVHHLSYGPEPSDRIIWQEHPGDEYAGEFWDMLEHPERQIPGSWD